MNISPIDIQQQQFKGKMFGGLDSNDVDAFLQVVSMEMEGLIRENADLKEQNRKASAEIEETRQRENSLRETMLAAQKITEEMKANAKRESTLIISEAELKAERLLADAENRLLQLGNQIQDLRREKLQFETSFRSILENHLKLLTINDE
jgi:cell division initiation protein